MRKEREGAWAARSAWRPCLSAVVRAGRPADPNDRSAYIEGVVGHECRSHVRHTLGFTVGGADALQSQREPPAAQADCAWTQSSQPRVEGGAAKGCWLGSELWGGPPMHVATLGRGRRTHPNRDRLTLGERQIRQCALVKSDRGYARSRPEARAPMEWCGLRRSPKQPSSLARRSAAPHVQATLTHDQAAAPAPYAAAWPRSRCQFLGDSTRSSEH